MLVAVFCYNSATNSGFGLKQTENGFEMSISCVCEWVYVKPCGVFYFGFTTLLSAFPIYIGVRKFITDLLIIKTVRASDLKITKIFAAGNSFCKLNLTLLFLVIFGVYIGEIFHYCLFSIDF